MEGFVGEEEGEFIGDAKLDREPVEVDESGVMCCQGLVSAEFCTYWSQSRASLSALNRTLLL